MTLFDNQDFRNRAVRAGSIGPRAGFFENLAAGFEQGDLGTSDAVQSRLLEQTNKIRQRLFGQGIEAPDPPMSQAGAAAMTPPSRQPDEAVEFDEDLERFASQLRELAKKHPEAFQQANAPTTVEGIMGEVRDSFRQTQEEFRSAAIRSGFMGDTGRFIGQIAGGMADPIALASMAAGAPLTAGIVRTAAIEAGIAGATEIPIQALVQTQREELGLDAGVDRALQNIAFAAAGGGILGGGLRGIARGGSKLADAARRLREEAPERVLDDPDLDAATTNEINLDDVTRRDPFIDIEAGRRQFQDVMTDDLRRVARDLDVPRRQAAAPANREAVDAVGENAPSRVATADAIEPGVRIAEAAGARFQSRQRQTARSESERAMRQIVAEQVNEVGPERLAEQITAIERLRPEARKFVEKQDAAQAADATPQKQAAATRQRNKFQRLFKQETGQELSPTPAQIEAIGRGQDSVTRASAALDQLDIPVTDGQGGTFPASTIAARLREFQQEQAEEFQPRSGPQRASEAAARDVADQERVEDLSDELTDQNLHQLRETVRNLGDDEPEPLVPDPDNPEADPIPLSEALDRIDEDERIVNEVADCIGRST